MSRRSRKAYLDPTTKATSSNKVRLKDKRIAYGGLRSWWVGG